jgi:hypothetical protein
MRRYLGPSVLGLALGSLGATGVAQAAPAVSVDHPCYRSETGIGVTGNGFTPNGSVTLHVDYEEGTGVLPVTADANGAFFVRVSAPEVEGRPTATLTALDEQRAAQGAPPAEQAATTQFTLTFYYAFLPGWSGGGGSGYPGRRMPVEAAGWTHAIGETLFAHYVRDKRRVKRVRIGVLRGPCGDLVTRMRQFPFRPVPRGTYTVIVDTGSRYPNSTPGFEYKVRVKGRDARGASRPVAG